MSSFLPFSPRRIVLVLICLLGVGCESTVSDEGSRLMVRASSRLGAGEDTLGGGATYRLRFYNRSSQEHVAEALPVLVQALADRGYRSVPPSEDPAILVWVGAAETQVNREVVDTSQGAPAAQNSESVRHRNVAGLMGRYRSLMTKDRYSGGEMLIGPDGEVIMTGNLASSVTDDVQFATPLPTREVLRHRNVLAIWAVPTGVTKTAEDVAELWRVEAESEYDPEGEPADFGKLVRTAVRHLGTNTDGVVDASLGD